MHYFQFNIKSYRADTAHLSNDEDLAYRRLLEHYYDTEQPIPKPLPPLTRRLRLAEPVLLSVLNEFFTETENGWIHQFCDSEIAKYHAFLERQKANGSKGGRGNKADAKPNKPKPLPEKPKPKPTTNHKPLTNISNTDVLDDKQSARFNALDYLCSLGVDRTVASDWIQLRKSQKASPTITAIAAIMKEASKAGLSPDDALTMCCQRGWRGFKAEWANGSFTAKQTPKSFEHIDYGKGGLL